MGRSVVFPIALPPFRLADRPEDAHERRIVHITLRQDDRVATESVGKGRDRAVTIVPKTPSGSTD